MNYFLYYILLGVWCLFSLLPLRIHYIISDFLFWLLYKVIGYRRRVVWKNLSASFPEKSEAELKEIERFFRSGWFGVLTKVDPDLLITNLRKEKKQYDY